MLDALLQEELLHLTEHHHHLWILHDVRDLEIVLLHPRHEEVLKTQIELLAEFFSLRGDRLLPLLFDRLELLQLLIDLIVVRNGLIRNQVLLD